MGEKRVLLCDNCRSILRILFSLLSFQPSGLPSSSIPKKEGETTALAKRSIAAGGVLSTPSTITPHTHNCLFDIQSSWKDVCACTPL